MGGREGGREEGKGRKVRETKKGKKGGREGGRERRCLTVLSVTMKTVLQFPPRESRRMEVMTLFR